MKGYYGISYKTKTPYKESEHESKKGPLFFILFLDKLG